MVFKKIFVFLLVLVMIAGVTVGCSSKDSVSTDDTQSDASVEKEAKADTDAPAEKEKTYIIACDSKYAPFSMEVDGVYKGIDVELLAAVAEVEEFNYELRPMDFSGIIPAIVSGQIDGSIAGMNITEKRKESVDFSEGYIYAASSIVANINDTTINSLDDLQGKTAAVKKGTTGAAFAEDNQEKYNLKINYYDDSPSMALAVSNGQADFLVEDLPVIAYQIKIGAQEKLRIAVDEIEDPPMDGFAVKKGENQELLKMFNDGLAKLRENGKLDEIIGQYVN